MSDNNHSRYIEWQRRLAPFSGTLVCMTGLVFLSTTIAPDVVGIPLDLSLRQRILIGLFFEAVGSLFLWWGLKKKPDFKA
jgi:hypothetical protein